MSYFNGLEIGFCLLFGFILLVLSAELYYLLWYSNKFSKTRKDIENSNITPSKHSPYTSCWKTSKSLKPQEKDLQTHIKQQESDMGLGQDLVLKQLEGESLDLELMRLHNLSGPPRFLFTINEETKEDLESELSKRVSMSMSRTRSLSDILDSLDTPFLSPLASPPLKVPLQHELNPFFECNEFGVNRVRAYSSPPPTFKFLRDAEEKLLKRAIFKNLSQDSPRKLEGKDGSFVKFGVSKGNSEGGLVSTSSSKVLPLPNSPSKTVDSIGKKWSSS